MMKILSVVVPTYNMEKFLDRCLSSLVIDRGLMDELEVLVVNDGSKDRSSLIAHEYESRYPGTFRVVDKENGNYGSCVNAALPLAQGKYFRILDADDWFESDVLRAFVEFLRTHSADLVFSPYTNVYESGHKELTALPSGIEYGKVYTAAEFSGWAASIHMQMHGMTFSLEVLRSCGLRLSEGISYTDTEYCYYPLRGVGSITSFDGPLYQYFSGREGQTMELSSLQRNIPQLLQVFGRMAESESSLQDDPRYTTLRLYTLPLFKRVMELFYWTILLNSPRSAELDGYLVCMDSCLGRLPELYSYSESLSLNRLHYVSIWRKTGMYNTGLLGRLNNRLWQIIFRLKHRS